MPDGQIVKLMHHTMRREIIGRMLGQRPRTGDTIDVRTAVFVNDPDGDPYMALSQRGWAEVADPSTIKDGELAERSRAVQVAPEPQTETLF